MPIQSAPGHPVYSGNFIPEIWSGKLVEKFYDATVFASICNTDYEGEIKDVGDKVHIRTVPDIVIRDYQKGGTLQTQRPNSPKKELNIDKGKYFSFVCDDIDKHQADIALMDKWGIDSSEQMKIVVDTGILGDVFADAHPLNKGATAGRKSGSYALGATGSPVAIDKTNVLDYLVDCGSVLGEQNVPETGRWIVIPEWMAGMIKKSDLKDASLTGDGKSVLRNGRIGDIDRFTLYVSNNLAVTSDSGFSAYNVIFGHKSAITFAAQMTKMETLRAESTFGEIVRGLNVYGYETIKSESLGLLYCRKA